MLASFFFCRYFFISSSEQIFVDCWIFLFVLENVEFFRLFWNFFVNRSNLRELEITIIYFGIIFTDIFSFKELEFCTKSTMNFIFGSLTPLLRLNTPLAIDRNYITKVNSWLPTITLHLLSHYAYNFHDDKGNFKLNVIKWIITLFRVTNKHKQYYFCFENYRAER